jgi:hypothetical protein
MELDPDPELDLDPGPVPLVRGTDQDPHQNTLETMWLLINTVPYLSSVYCRVVIPEG